MMSSARSSSFPLAVAALLLASLAALAALQWRWIGEVSAMDRQRLRTSLAGAAARYAHDFDREITRAFVAFLPAAHADTRAGLEQAILTHYDRWADEATYPDLIRTVYLVSRGDDSRPALAALRPDTGRFEPAPWLPELEAVQRRTAEVFARSGNGSGGGFEARMDARFDARFSGRSDPDSAIRLYLLPEVPALRIPLGTPVFTRPHRRSSAAAGAEAPDAERRPADAFLLVVFDADTIADRLLPDLTREHFGSVTGDDYALAVTSGSRGARVLYRSDPAVPIEVFERAEIRSDLFALRPFADLHGPWSDRPGARRRSAAPAGGDGLDRHVRHRDHAEAAPEMARAPRGAGAWVLAVARRDGSLEAAVAAIRRRNLAVSSGILAVLALTTGILLVSTQRAKRLARQQIEFVASVTHELHTPLTAIRSAGENLADGIVAEPAQVRRYGRLIEDEGRRLSAMVGQVLEFAGIQSGRRSYRRDALAIAEMVDGALADARWRLEEAKIEVRREVAPDLPAVAGDAQALRQAIQNLIENAVKYGGPERWIGISAHSVDGGVEVAVADRGPGIPAADLPRVFEPFYRGQNATAAHIPGSGLGLSLVRHIVEAHDGRVTVRRGDPQRGEVAGTIVTLHLPAADAPGASA